MKISEFVSEYGVTVEPVLLERADMPSKMDVWAVTLRTDASDGAFRMFYRTGTGLRARNDFELAKAKRGEDFGRLPFRATVDQRDRSRPVPPTAADVLYCLASDFASVANVSGVGEFIEEFGADDGRMADAYNAICVQRTNAIRELGRAAWAIQELEEDDDD